MDGTASRKKLRSRLKGPSLLVIAVCGVEEESVMALTNTNVTFEYGGDLKNLGWEEETHI